MQSRNFKTSQTTINSNLSSNTMQTNNIDIGFDGQPIGARGGFVLSTQPDIPTDASHRYKRGKSAWRQKDQKRTFLRSNSLTRFVQKKFHKSTVSLAAETAKRRLDDTRSLRSEHSFRSKTGITSAKSFSNYDWNESLDGDNSQVISLTNSPIYDEEIEPSTQEVYAGEWYQDRREGLGVCERTDGFKYEGEWMNNRRHGYGRTTFPDGTVEEGKYRFNVLMPPSRYSTLLKFKGNRHEEKLQAIITQAVRVSESSQTKADISMERMLRAIEKSEDAENRAVLSRDEASIARCVCKELAPSYSQVGLEYGRRGDMYDPVERSQMNTDDKRFLSEERLMQEDPQIEDFKGM